MCEALKAAQGWANLEIFNATWSNYLEFSEAYVAGKAQPEQPTGPLPTQSSAGVPVANNPVVLFEKSIKHDPKDFPVIKEMRQWDRINQSWQARARLQGAESALDPNYMPSGADHALFNKQKECAYSALDVMALESSLHAECNKAPIGGGQSAYKRIKAKAETSTAAQSYSQKQLLHLTTT